jgi:flagellar basal-body rod modification protein FlgD
MTAISNALDVATGAGAGPKAGVSANGEVSQLFTTLLVAQIKYQNPLEPQDPSQFVSQLTQLSQMEALQSLNKQGSTNGAMLESLQVLALGSQVGSQVTAKTDQIVVGSEPIQGRFTLADGDTDIALVVRSASGERRIAFGTRGAGDMPFTIDPGTLGLAPGTYSVHVETKSGASPAVEVAGTLQTVRMSAAQGVVLEVANIGQISSGSVTSFDGRTATN